MLRQRNRAVNKSNTLEEARRAIATGLRTELYFSILSSQRAGSKVAASELRSADVEYGISNRDSQEALAKSADIANRYAAYWLVKAEESDEDSESARATEASQSTDSRLELIAVTESAIAYNEGKQLIYPTDGSVLYRVWDSSFDQRTCPTCESADGDKVLINENFPRGEPGEVHPNCFVPGTIIQGDLSAASKSWHSGDIIQVRTSSGRRLTVTPNHPILTDAGFVQAKFLTHGQDLISYSGEPWVPGLSPKNNIEYRPTSVAEIFDSFRLAECSGSSANSTFNFNNKARFLDRNVDVVSSNSKLLSHSIARLSDNSRNIILKKAFMEAIILDCINSFEFFIERCLSSTGSTMCTLDLIDSLFNCHLGPLGNFCFGSGSELHTSDAEISIDDLSRKPEIVGELFNRFPSIISRDKIVNIYSMHYSGHVYDAQSLTGWVIADGIIAHNCRCTYSILTEAEANRMAA